jgi:methylmalonyl-CoA/ethylmalonyl-CoA epimerase
MLRIEHIGIAVKDLDLSNELFSKLLNRSHYKVEEVTSEKVATSFFQTGESKIELLAATSPDSTIVPKVHREEGRRYSPHCICCK